MSIVDRVVTHLSSYGKIYGAVFTSLVIALLVGFVTAEVLYEDWHDGYDYKGVVIESGISEDVLGHVAKMEVNHKGDPLPSTVDVSDDFELCTGVDVVSAEHIAVQCRRGWVSIVPWTANMAACQGDQCEAGNAVWGPAENPKWCTIFLPPSVELSLQVEALDSSGVLHPDIDALVLAHEWEHCKGVGHTYTKFLGFLKADQPGNLMNDSTLEMGWGLDDFE